MKLKYIDAIRGFAILGVIIVHTGLSGSNNYHWIIDSIIKQGARGVQLFFIASAITLFLSYNHRKTFEKNYTLNFFIRRFFRIAPLYYLGIVYYLYQDGFGARYWLGDAEYISISNILSNIFFIHGINPYWITSIVPGGWSITVEMTFYAIIPFLIKKIKSINYAIIFTILTLFISIFLNKLLGKYPLIGYERLWYQYLFFYFPNQLSIFGIGIITYFYIIRRNDCISSLNFILIAILTIAHCIWNFIPVHFLFGIGFSIFIIALSQFEFKLFVNKLTIFLGKISFSAYISHFAVLYWLTYFNFVDYFKIDNEFDSLLNYIIRLVIVLSITSLISYMLLILIEKPFQKLGKSTILIIEKKFKTSLQ